MKSSRLAVDVVILPPDDVLDIAIALNKNLNGEITLGKTSTLPHISLSMGVIVKNNTEKVSSILNRIAEEFLPIQLEISRIYKKTGVGLEIVKTKQLQYLHETIIKDVSPYFSHDNINKNIFYKTKTLSLNTQKWVSNYPNQAGFDNFTPHISLGYGVLPKENIKIKFKATKLALCHLGNHAACQKILTLFENRSVK